MFDFCWQFTVSSGWRDYVSNSLHFIPNQTCPICYTRRINLAGATFSPTTIICRGLAEKSRHSESVVVVGKQSFSGATGHWLTVKQLSFARPAINIPLDRKRTAKCATKSNSRGNYRRARDSTGAGYDDVIRGKMKYEEARGQLTTFVVSLTTSAAT